MSFLNRLVSGMRRTQPRANTFASIRPLIVPRSYFADDAFPAPHIPLAAPDLALTWVELTAGQTMLYVTRERAAAWDAEGADFRGEALAAMRRADAGLLFTEEKRTDWGSLVWGAMMHDDGLGSSRLLLREELNAQFPSGYWIAIPDRSFALAISRDIPDAELDELRFNVERMHLNATTPMLPDIREPDELLPLAIECDS